MGNVPSRKEFGLVIRILKLAAKLNFAEQKYVADKLTAGVTFAVEPTDAD
jgi:hypothetical protein